MVPRPYATIDAEMQTLRQQRTSVHAQLRVLARERDARTLYEVRMSAVQQLTPEQQQAVAEEIAAIGTSV